MNAAKPQPKTNAQSFTLRQLLVVVAMVAFWMALFSWNHFIGITVGVSVVPAVLTVTLLRFIRKQNNAGRSTRKTGTLICLLSLAYFVFYILSFGPFLAYWDTLPVLESQKKDESVLWEFYRPADDFTYHTSLQWYLNFWSEPGIKSGHGS